MQHAKQSAGTLLSPGGPGQAFIDHINNSLFPCIAARSAVKAGKIAIYESPHLACPIDDQSILQFLYDFVDSYRENDDHFTSAAVLFHGPCKISEDEFESLLWRKLQALHDLDCQNYQYDKRVESNPDSKNFSFSLKEEAFFIIGLHPGSSRHARNFKYPAIVFNPHQQFEKLRADNRFEKMKMVIRKRDVDITGSINPMLSDFGERSETFQYSGKVYDAGWTCPLKINHE
ncbi:guanitoxin biosynthesis heme-dependent pre-guanitoxin N-hydroxylase GntA [Flavitalea sp.]|nr:guanitoxin biosynthesis heme-dependent pre-guanitoxin N-hydroxylase GntA [Flavitalea sp.]